MFLKNFFESENSWQGLLEKQKRENSVAFVPGANILEVLLSIFKDFPLTNIQQISEVFLI